MPLRKRMGWRIRAKLCTGSFYISESSAISCQVGPGARASSPHLAREEAGWKPALPGMQKLALRQPVEKERC